jgi:hypothetical protein
MHMYVHIYACLFVGVIIDFTLLRKTTKQHTQGHKPGKSYMYVSVCIYIDMCVCIYILTHTHISNSRVSVSYILHTYNFRSLVSSWPLHLFSHTQTHSHTCIHSHIHTYNFRSSVSSLPLPLFSWMDSSGPHRRRFSHASSPLLTRYVQIHTYVHAYIHKLHTDSYIRTCINTQITHA